MYNNQFRKSCGNPENFKHWARKFKEAKRARHGSPAVNILEEDEQYQLHLFAPGLQKSDFDLQIEELHLTIKGHGGKKRSEDEKWQTWEYSPGKFKRSFKLNSKIDKENISAAYENGVLMVTLPKKESSKTERRAIEIS